jgi:hypothetical protein
MLMGGTAIDGAIECKKKPGVYNFTGLVLSNSIFKVLNMGKNAIYLLFISRVKFYFSITIVSFLFIDKSYCSFETSM